MSATKPFSVCLEGMATHVKNLLISQIYVLIFLVSSILTGCVTETKQAPANLLADTTYLHGFTKVAVSLRGKTDSDTGIIMAHGVTSPDSVEWTGNSFKTRCRVQ